MRKVTIKTMMALFSAGCIFTACNKNVSSSPAVSNSTPDGSAATAAGETTVMFRPGPKNGNDAFVNYLASDPTSVNGNFGKTPELGVDSWTDDGAAETRRFYISFDSLTKVPATVKIVSAKLQLFGLAGTSISHPQGNSIYPGSPYDIYPDNSALVQRVVKKWDESTITWANQPDVTAVDEAVIPSSTDQWNYNPVIDVTALVKKMVANPARNFGFKITMSNESIYRALIFASSESSVVSSRPKLTVVYE